MNTITAALNGGDPPGIYRIRLDADISALMATGQIQGWRLFQLNGAVISRKSDFLNQAAVAMNFPNYFGHNWDAFEDCLTDLDWVPAQRYVLLLTQPENFAQSAPAEWKTLFDIFESAIEFWRTTETPMYILFQTDSPLFGNLANL